MWEGFPGVRLVQLCRLSLVGVCGTGTVQNAGFLADLFHAQRKYLKLLAPEECKLLQATAYAMFFICPITSLLQNQHLK